MSKWKEVVFSDLFSEGTRNGVFKTNGKPVVDARLIGMGTLFHNDFIRRSPEETLGLTADEYARFSVRAGDLLFGRRSLVESGAGKVSLVVAVDSPTVFESSLIRVRLDPSKADPRFYAYYFKAGVGRGRIFALVNGAAVKGIRSSDLQKVVVHCPPLPTQKRIADILSAYDDLIENNRRRMEILEESARLIYRKRFGGKKANGTKMPLSELADVVMGQSPESSTYNEDGVGLPFHQGVAGFGVRYPITEKWCTAGSRFAEEGDILFSVRAPVGRINVSREKIVIGRGLSAMRAKNGCQSWLLHTLKNHFSKEDMIGVGCIFASTTKKELFSVELLVPPDVEIKKFEQEVAPMDEQIRVLTDVNLKLAKARDMLLPKLMSGKGAA